MRYLICLLLVLCVSCSCPEPEPEVITVERIVEVEIIVERIIEVEAPSTVTKIVREARKRCDLLAQFAWATQDMIDDESDVIAPAFRRTINILCYTMRNLAGDLSSWTPAGGFTYTLDVVTSQRLEEFFSTVRELIERLDGDNMDISNELIRRELRAHLQSVEGEEELINALLEQMRTFTETGE